MRLSIIALSVWSAMGKTFLFDSANVYAATFFHKAAKQQGGAE